MCLFFFFLSTLTHMVVLCNLYRGLSWVLFQQMMAPFKLGSTSWDHRLHKPHYTQRHKYNYFTHTDITLTKCCSRKFSSESWRGHVHYHFLLNFHQRAEEQMLKLHLSEILSRIWSRSTMFFYKSESRLVWMSQLIASVSLACIAAADSDWNTTELLFMWTEICVCVFLCVRTKPQIWADGQRGCYWFNWPLVLAVLLFCSLCGVVLTAAQTLFFSWFLISVNWKPLCSEK